MDGRITNAIGHLRNTAKKMDCQMACEKLEEGRGEKMFQCDIFIPTEEKVISEFHLLGDICREKKMSYQQFNNSFISACCTG